MITKILKRTAGLLCAAVLVSACTEDKPPQETAAAFWHSVVEHDAAEAVEYSTLTGVREYDGFSRDWEGYEPSWGRLVVDGDEASAVTTLSHPARPDEEPVEFVTYLVRQDDQWKVDYARTAEAMDGPLAGLFAQLDRLGGQIADRFRLASGDLETELKRLGEQFEQLSESAGARASERIDAYGEALRQSIEELGESVERALEEERQLPERERRALTEVVADLGSEADRLSEPTVRAFADSSRAVAAAGRELAAVDHTALEPYRAQWRESVQRFERDMRRILQELSTLQDEPPSTP